MGSTMTSGIRVDYGRMLDALGIEGRLLVAAARDADPDIPVPGVSARTVRETIRHLDDLYADALSWLGASGPAAQRTPEADLSTAIGHLTAGLAALLAGFGTRSPGQPCRTWWPEDRTVDFWLRRMVHATALHRVDVQAATGMDVTTIEPDIALDGVDEALTVWFGYRLNVMRIRPARVCSVQVRAGDQRWLVTTDYTGSGVTRLGAADQSTEDAAIDGDPQTVFLWLWGRLPDRLVRPTGDLDAIAQLWGLLMLATS